MKRIALILVAGLCACIVRAEPFWISYDATCGQFPEEVGWPRLTYGGGAVRSISDGVLTLDSMADPMICDCYNIDGSIAPGLGETFVAEWRVCLVQQSGYCETLAHMQTDDGGGAAFDYWMDHIRSEDAWTVPITPGVFHTYRLESSCVNTYSFWIDDAWVHDGVLDYPGPPLPFVGFGDCTYGATRSLSEWEYFRFGIVPEPGGLALALAAGACVARRRRAGARPF